MPAAQGPIHVKPKPAPKPVSQVHDVKSAADLGRAVAYHKTQQAQQRVVQHQVHDVKSEKDLFKGRGPGPKAQQEHKQLVNLARRVIAVHNVSHITPTHDTKSALELITADAFKLTPQFQHDLTASSLARAEYQRAQDEAAQHKEEGKYKGSIPKLGLGLLTGHGPIIAAANEAANVAGSVGRDIAKYNPIFGVTNPGHFLASKVPGLKQVEKKVQSVGQTVIPAAAREAIDIPANAIPSVYHLAEPLAHGNVKETLNRATQPYKDTFGHGVGHALSSIEHHPLTSTLMVVGPARGLSRAAGRAERTVRPYEPIRRKLPGTAAAEVILPNKGFIGYRRQLKAELRKAEQQGGHVRMSDRNIRYRIDQHFYQEQLLSREAAQKAYKDAKERGLPESQAKQESIKKYEEARSAYRDSAYTDVALRGRGGRGDVRRFKNADIASGFSDSWRQRMFNLGRDVPNMEPVRLNSGKFVLVPHSAIHQFKQHDSSMTPTVVSSVGTTVTGAFRRTVLPFSLKWMNANLVEGALRDTISGGVLPASMKAGLDFRNYLKETNPEYYARWKTLVAGGGHGQMQRHLLVEQNMNTFEHRTAETALAGVGKTLTEWGKKPSVQTAANAFDKYTDFVFHTMNGSWERAVHMGMAGKVLRDNPLMSKELRTIAQKATQEVAHGTSDSELMNIMIPFGRELHKMFGKYGGFSPSTRRSIATWTPFIAWTGNSIQFVLHYLPKDHPLTTALLADANRSSQEWRQNKGLAYFMKGAVPWWLMGSVPVGSGKLRASQMTPFGFWGDPTMVGSGTFNPLGQSIYQNLQGKDWKGKDLPGNIKNNPYMKTGMAFLTAIEGTVPITGIAAQIAQGKSASEVMLPYRPLPPQKKRGSSNNIYDLSTPSSSGSNPYDKSTSSKSSNPYDH